MEQKIKTLLEYNRDLKKCSYCKGLGYDIFDHSKPCPNCSKDSLIIIKSKSMTKNEFQKLIGENPEDVLGKDWQNEINEEVDEEKEKLIDEKINLECWLNHN